VSVTVPICEMHPNTRLVLVDIPGLNEAKMGNKYKDYVKSKWHMFDCVIVVMDAKQGVNTDDQVELFRFVKSNQTIRWQPVIILCNKVDDPDDEEQAEMMIEARQEVEKIFAVTNREKSLQQLLSIKDSVKKHLQHLPAFLRIATNDAYFLQTAHLLTFDQFRQFDDKLLLDKYGKNIIGRLRWNKLSQETRMKELYDYASDPDTFQESLSGSNFQQFTKVFGICIGKPEMQLNLVVDRLKATLCCIQQCDQFVDLHKIYKEVAHLCENKSILPQAETDIWRQFSKIWEKSKEDALLSFDADPLCISVVAKPIVALEDFHGFVNNKFQYKKQEIAKAVVQLLSTTVLNMMNKLVYHAGSSKSGSKWSSLQPQDWIVIWSSILLVASDPIFYESFGTLKVKIEELLFDARWADKDEKRRGYQYAPMPSTTVMKIPESLADPQHFGHIAWRYCKFMDRETEKKT
jgi:signal recognition particle receptor subunit beta